MKRPKNYRTKQSEAIFEYIASLGEQHVTANQIAAHFESEEFPIGIATIYRHLEKYVQNGTVRKYNIDGASGACYQYLSEEHDCNQIHLKCEGCGAVLHLQCDILDSMPQHVYKEHAFRINPFKTVFYGKCSNCMDEYN